MHILRLTALTFLAGTPALAFQDSFNVDFGSTAFGFGVPQNTFGGAANSPGVWNEIDTDSIAAGVGGVYTSNTLLTKSGAPSTVTLTFDALGGTFTPFEFQNLATSGDDEALLDDCYYRGGMSRITINNLPPGTYTLYTYAMAPDSNAFFTGIDVPGSTDPLQSVGGTFAGYMSGVTHAEHTIVVTAGMAVVIDITVVTSFDSINGLQIVSGGPGSVGTNYCTANANSTGQASSMSATGSAVVATNNLTLHCTNAPAGAFGYFLTSQTQGLTPNPAGSQGILCLGGAIGRYVAPGQVLVSNASGEYLLLVDLTMHPTPGGLMPVNAGETWHFTLWHRDLVAGTPTSNFADGLTIMFN